jgi:hypothetical protein
MAALKFARCSRAFAGGAWRAVSAYNQLQQLINFNNQKSDQKSKE